MSPKDEPTENLAPPRWVTLTIYGGWCSLLLSAVCLYWSVHVGGPEVTFVLWITAARLFGIVAFGIGAVAIVHQQWTSATLLFAGSVGLPIISLAVLGTL